MRQDSCSFYPDSIHRHHRQKQRKQHQDKGNDPLLELAVAVGAVAQGINEGEKPKLHERQEQQPGHGKQLVQGVVHHPAIDREEGFEVGRGVHGDFLR